MTRSQPDYKLHFHLPNGLVQIHPSGATELTLPSRILTKDEMAAVAVFAQVMSKLRYGKLVHYNIKLDDFEDDDELVKCEWLRSGNLKLHGVANKIWNLVETKEVAAVQKGVFTCTRGFYKSLPRRRKTGVQKLVESVMEVLDIPTAESNDSNG